MNKGNKVMIKNVIFDIGNVILNFNVDDVLSHFATTEAEKQWMMDNIVNTPEWYENSMIDTGFVTKEDAIILEQDRTNHENDELIERFWTTYTQYEPIDAEMIKLIKRLKRNGYKVYLLSNINQHNYDRVATSGLFDIIDGGVYSYKEHKIKPYRAIYETCLERYNLVPNECLFVDDSAKNIETAKDIGMNAEQVNKDDYIDVLRAIYQYNVLGNERIYIPQPINTSDVTLAPGMLVLQECIAKNVHDVWAKGRMEEGWQSGEIKDSERKLTPCLVPYENLPESEKEFDRNTALETLKLIKKLGYTISKD